MSDRTSHEIETLTIRIPIRLQRRGGRKLIMTPEGVAAPARKPRRDEALVKALVRAHRWRRKIESGHAKSITDLAEQEGVTDAYVCRLLPLTCLAPDIVESISTGGSRRGLCWPRCWEMGRWRGRSSGRGWASAINASCSKDALDGNHPLSRFRLVGSPQATHLATHAVAGPEFEGDVAEAGLSMLKVVDVIGLACTGAYDDDASLVTRTKIVRIARLGSGRFASRWSVSSPAATRLRLSTAERRTAKSGMCRSLAWRRTSWRRSSTGGPLGWKEQRSVWGFTRSPAPCA
jgi:hypothetical protein